MTQAALAEKLGLKEQHISQWEHGIRNPKFSSLCKIAAALNVSVFELTEASQHDYALEQNIEALRKERDELHRIIDQTTVRLNDETARVFALQRRCDDLEKSRQAWVQKAMALGRHGHWIKDGDVQVCSECGAEHGWDEYRASFCEDCGAQMDEVLGIG